MTTQQHCKFCLWYASFLKKDSNFAALSEFYSLRGGSIAFSRHNKLIEEALKNEPIATNFNWN